MRALTQEELLAEAAYTELENLRSLEIMQAAEEEVKKKAAVIRARHSGPVIRYHSKVVDGESLVRFPNHLTQPEPMTDGLLHTGALESAYDGDHDRKLASRCCFKISNLLLRRPHPSIRHALHVPPSYVAGRHHTADDVSSSVR